MASGPLIFLGATGALFTGAPALLAFIGSKIMARQDQWLKNSIPLTDAAGAVVGQLYRIEGEIVCAQPQETVLAFSGGSVTQAAWCSAVLVRYVTQPPVRTTYANARGRASSAREISDVLSKRVAGGEFAVRGPDGRFEVLVRIPDGAAGSGQTLENVFVPDTGFDVYSTRSQFNSPTGDLADYAQRFPGPPQLRSATDSLSVGPVKMEFNKPKERWEIHEQMIPVSGPVFVAGTLSKEGERLVITSGKILISTKKKGDEILKGSQDLVGILQNVAKIGGVACALCILVFLAGLLI